MDISRLISILNVWFHQKKSNYDLIRYHFYDNAGILIPLNCTVNDINCTYVS